MAAPDAQAGALRMAQDTLAGIGRALVNDIQKILSIDWLSREPVRAKLRTTYLARLAETLLTPAERAERAAKARAVLREWNGYDPDEHEQAELDAELDRRMTEAGAV